MLNVPLKIALVRTGKRQFELADALGLSELRLSQILHGRTTPTEAERARMAEVLGVSERVLFGVVRAAAK